MSPVPPGHSDWEGSGAGVGWRLRSGSGDSCVQNDWPELLVTSPEVTTLTPSGTNSRSQICPHTAITTEYPEPVGWSTLAKDSVFDSSRELGI